MFCWAQNGATEIAGQENAGLENDGQIAGVENAGLEIDGQKLKGVENDGHSIKGQLTPVHVHHGPCTFELIQLSVGLIRHKIPTY